MRKEILGMAMFAILASTARGQVGSGGFPLSTQAHVNTDYVPVTYAKLPDIGRGLKNWEANKGPKPALVALMTPAALSFPNSGAMYTMRNGTRIWRAQLNVDGAKALGLYYNQFHLPEGVKLYLSNKNGRHVLGAYTEFNNDSETNKFATEAVEGEVVNIELDINANVNLSDIRLQIDRAAAYFTGIGHLAPFGDLVPLDAYDSQFTGGSSVCMINAVCPQGNGYEIQRNSAFQILVPITVNGMTGLGTCSANMVNTTTNTPANCKQYFLLASHCEFSNATTDAAFSQVILRFNYQHSVCSPAPNTIPNTQQTMTGAKFVARSICPLLSDGTPDATRIKGDFLLLELKQAIPASWNMNLAGWNNSPDIPLTNTPPKKFIGFHHPAGDVKKVSSGNTIASGTLAAQDSHWGIEATEGLFAQGSSGSALFDGDGRDIGVASIGLLGTGVTTACSLNSKGEDVSLHTTKTLYYSKISYIWDYSVDGPAAIHKLKPWLNPNNSNMTTTNAVKSDCSPIGGTGITIDNGRLDQSINVYPNPGNGMIVVQINLNEAADLHLELYDITGKKLNAYDIRNVRKENFALDLNKYSSGMYLLKVSDGYHISSKKIMINH